MPIGRHDDLTVDDERKAHVGNAGARGTGRRHDRSSRVAVDALQLSACVGAVGKPDYRVAHGAVGRRGDGRPIVLIARRVGGHRVAPGLFRDGFWPGEMSIEMIAWLVLLPGQTALTDTS